MGELGTIVIKTIEKDPEKDKYLNIFVAHFSLIVIKSSATNIYILTCVFKTLSTCFFVYFDLSS